MIEGSWDNFVPVRLLVEWEYRGEPGLHPNIESNWKGSCTANRKRFTRFEKLIAKLMKAPKIVRRTMHYTQSMLWELIDGERNFTDICSIMKSVYHEDIAPVEDRIKAYLEVFVRLNVASIYRPREEE